MPTSSIEVAQAWKDANKPHKGRKTIVQEPLIAPDFTLAEGEDAYAVRDRLSLAERTIAAQIEAWTNTALPKAIEERNNARSSKALIEAERKISQINSKIEALRKEHRAASKAALDAHKAVANLEESRGILINMDEAKELVTKAITPVVIALHKLPDSAETTEDRQKFTAIAEALLSTLRQSAASHVSEVNETC